MRRAFRVMLHIDSARAYERALLSGIARYSQLHGPWIFSHLPPFWETQSPKSLLACMTSIDGIIMVECSYLPEVVKLGLPVIVSNYATEHINGLPNIVSDHRAIGCMAADHLIDKGFRNFAFCGYGDYFWSIQRGEGLAARLQEVGHKNLAYAPSAVHRRVFWEGNQQVLIRWLRSLPKPVGLMACIDERSQEVAEACKAAGLSVPDQVGIVGVDNDELICRLSSIPLSSVALSAEKAGYQAAGLLDNLMRGQTRISDSIEVRPTHVVTRASTDVVAIEDPQISHAAKFIQDNCRGPVYVAEVAKVVGLSRRVLEKRFRATLKRSVNEHIRQCRINLIMQLLPNTDMTVLDIALYTGFSDAAHIARYFKGQTGMSLAEYRRNYQ